MIKLDQACTSWLKRVSQNLFLLVNWVQECGQSQLVSSTACRTLLEWAMTKGMKGWLQGKRRAKTTGPQGKPKGKWNIEFQKGFKGKLNGDDFRGPANVKGKTSLSWAEPSSRTAVQ